MRDTSLRAAGFRAADAAWTVLFALLFIGLAVANWLWANSRPVARSNLHIAVAAARRLDEGTILKDDDLVVRIRRVDSMDQAFDEPKRLVGRQLRNAVARGRAIEEDNLVPLATTPVTPATFFVVVDVDAAGCIAKNMEVLLVRRGDAERKAAIPRFRVLAVSDVAPAKDQAVTKRRLQLRARHAEDAARIVGAKDTTFVPVIAGDVACP